MCVSIMIQGWLTAWSTPVCEVEPGTGLKSFPSRKTADRPTTVSTIKIVKFGMTWQSDCISFRYFIKLI